MKEKYCYIVTYCYYKKLYRHWGNTKITRSSPIKDLDDINAIEEDIKIRTKSRNVNIVNYILLNKTDGE